MGRVYTNVVISCLTCLDPQNQDFGDESEFMDEDGILVGVRYIEKVTLKMPQTLLLVDLADCHPQILYRLEDIRF